MLNAIIDNSHILSMLVARLGLFKFNWKFTYFIYMHQRMGNGAGSTDFTNFFSNDDFWSTLLL